MSRDASSIVAGHERDTARASRVALVGATLLVAIAIGLVVAWRVQPLLASRPASDAQAAAAEVARYDFEHAQGWLRHREVGSVRSASEHKLDSYGWVDRRAGVIHVPVERAVELLLHEGLRVENRAGEGSR